MKKLIIILCLLLFFVTPQAVFSATMQGAFQTPYHQLLSKAAEGSKLFKSREDLERALLSQPQDSRVDRMKKKIAAVRMLMADSQIKSGDEVSCSVLKLSAQRLVAAGEHWVTMAQAGEEKTAPSKEGTVSSAPTEKSEKEKREGECSKKDNRFDIGDCDEFNLFDIIAFPFRIIGWILELLFNIILFPFKLLAKIIF
jgi:hypothetical protein